VAITRTTETVSGPAQGRFGDYNRPESLAEAYVGLDRLLIITTVDPEPGKRGAQNVAAIDAAVKAGVKHIVFMSAVATRQEEEPARGASYWRGEQHLIATAPAWTILRMNFYAEAFVQRAKASLDKGVLAGLAENRLTRAAWAYLKASHGSGLSGWHGSERITGYSELTAIKIRDFRIADAEVCCLNAGRFAVAKIGSCFRMEEKIGNQQEDQAMNCHFLQRIEEADPHVERDPCQRKPTRPVVASQQKCSTDNCNKFAKFHQKIAIVKRMSRQDLAEVVNKADSPDTDIDAGEDRYGEGTFVHRREKGSTSVSIPLCY
jgi:hypothetical protein